MHRRATALPFAFLTLGACLSPIVGGSPFAEDPSAQSLIFVVLDEAGTPLAAHAAERDDLNTLPLAGAFPERSRFFALLYQEPLETFRILPGPIAFDSEGRALLPLVRIY